MKEGAEEGRLLGCVSSIVGNKVGPVGTIVGFLVGLIVGRNDEAFDGLLLGRSVG